MRYQVYDPRYQVPNTTKSRTTHYKKQLLPVINTCATWTATAFSVFNKVTQADLRVPRSQKIKRASSRRELAVHTFSFFVGTLSNLRESWEPGDWIHTCHLRTARWWLRWRIEEPLYLLRRLVSLDRCAICSQKSSACWIVYSNQVCGETTYI